MSQQDSNSASFSPNGCGCLVLLICIVVIGANILPPLLNSSNKSKQTVAKQYLKATNKAQQAYFAEKNGFATSMAALKIDMKTPSYNYNYLFKTTQRSAFIYGISKQKELKSYVGAVFVLPASKIKSNADKKQTKTTSILCQNDDPRTVKPAEPIYQNGKIACGEGTIDLLK